jgi:hypothetical protein
VLSCAIYGDSAVGCEAGIHQIFCEIGRDACFNSAKMPCGIRCKSGVIPQAACLHRRIACWLAALPPFLREAEEI